MSVQRWSGGSPQASGQPDINVEQPQGIKDENAYLGPCPQYESTNADDPAKAWINPK